MSIIQCRTQGRFGNQLFQYAHARAYAERHGCQLQVNQPWLGQQVFQLDDPHSDNSLPERTELTVRDGEVNICFHTYAQHQRAILYTPEQARSWFKLRPELEQQLSSLPIPTVAAHRRIGDYPGYGYPVVSEQSYHDACRQYGFIDGTGKLTLGNFQFYSEEQPQLVASLPDTLSFLPDFYCMMRSPTLFRANSSFSWWAALLGGNRVYSPIIDNLVGGIEHHCRFVPGNWPRLCYLDHVTNLYHPEPFREDKRYEYDLDHDSLVIDLGVYEGRFSRTIAMRYDCHILAYEPVPSFYEQSKAALADFPKVHIYPYGAAATKREATFNWKGDMTGLYSDGNQPITVQLESIATILGDRPNIDLMKVNIEGMEYELLESMVASDLIRRVRNLQVQYHCTAPDCQSRFDALHATLQRTHIVTWHYPFCWTNYERVF